MFISYLIALFTTKDIHNNRTQGEWHLKIDNDNNNPLIFLYISS